jgi:hypothetical protein
MTPLASTVWTQLQAHQGRQHAIAMPVLARQCGVSTRILQQIIHDLILDGKLVASATGPPSGYYVPVTEQEVDAAIRQLEARAYSCLKRVAAIKRQSLVQVAGQLQMDYAEPPCVT